MGNILLFSEDARTYYGIISRSVAEPADRNNKEPLHFPCWSRDSIKLDKLFALYCQEKVFGAKDVAAASFSRPEPDPQHRWENIASSKAFFVHKIFFLYMFD
jgi:hypothetical protein